MGGSIIFNCPNWDRLTPGNSTMELIDGKQRLEAVRGFLRGDFPVFGHRFNEFEDELSWIDYKFQIRVCSLHTRAEVLELYLNINAGGTPHTKKELARVQAMLEALA